SYKPRLDANQARLANALFSGVGDVTSPTASPTSTNVMNTTKRRTPASRTSVRQETTATGNLIGDFSSSPTATTSVNTSSSSLVAAATPTSNHMSPSTSKGDLLGDFMSTTPSTTSPTATTLASLIDDL